jgi:hypothetical protein
MVNYICSNKRDLILLKLKTDQKALKILRIMKDRKKLNKKKQYLPMKKSSLIIYKTFNNQFNKKIYHLSFSRTMKKNYTRKHKIHKFTKRISYLLIKILILRFNHLGKCHIKNHKH